MSEQMATLVSALMVAAAVFLAMSYLAADPADRRGLRRAAFMLIAACLAVATLPLAVRL